LRRQRFLLDRRLALLYIGACTLLAGCPGRLPPLVPMPLEPADRDGALTWASATLPARHTAIRFRWKYRDSDRRWGGRGQARIAPPDSLRFDYVGPLGLGAGAAVVVGDSAIWADPEQNFRSLVRAVRMLWAGFGVVRPPPGEAVISGWRAPSVAIWRFAQGADTFDYRVTDGGGVGGGGDRVLEAEWRQAGKIVARTRTQFDTRALPATARIDFPEGPARFELSVVAVDTAAVIDPVLWRRRR
jgi:hypothetical protein